MHILITDSGVGGLSVCAFAERYFRTHWVGEPVRLTYVNASRENDYGYNAMGSTREKLEHFDRYLAIITDRFQPDSIYIACNTLSVLFPRTEFSKNPPVPVRGIVETAVGRLHRGLEQNQDAIAVVFATPTTIDEETYPKLLAERGVPGGRIVSQACPGLADTISEDRGGTKANEEIIGCVREALGNVKHPASSCLALLACTHYGYRKELFAAALTAAGTHAEILNPNEFVIDDVFPSRDHSPRHERAPAEVEVEFVTRYRIPETALETITYFLKKISPRTIRAFQNYTYLPDLF